MKIRDYIEEVKKELKNQYQNFENYDNSWLDTELDDDLKEFIREKVSYDCFVLSGIEDAYAKYKKQDDINLIDAYNQGINYTEIEDLPPDSDNYPIFDDYNVPYNLQGETEKKPVIDPLYFGDNIDGIGKPFKQ